MGQCAAQQAASAQSNLRGPACLAKQPALKLTRDEQLGGGVASKSALGRATGQLQLSFLGQLGQCGPLLPAVLNRHMWQYEPPRCFT